MLHSEGTTRLVVTHETSSTKASNIVQHWLKAGNERYGFEEDTKVAVYFVNDTQIPRFEDAMLRALIAFKDQVERKVELTDEDEKVLAALDREIDRTVAMRRRSQ